MIIGGSLAPVSTESSKHLFSRSRRRRFCSRGFEGLARRMQMDAASEGDQQADLDAANGARSMNMT